MLQKEGICHALTIAAFTSSCQVNLGSLPLGPLGHHCLQPPHSVEKRHCLYILTPALGRPSRDVLLCPSRPLGLALRLSRSYLFRCHREILAAQEAGILAVSRALASSTSIFRLTPLQLAPGISSFACFSVFFCVF